MVNRVSSRAIQAILLGALATLGSGCARLDSTYGYASGESLNGTGTLTRIFREQGHQLRVARRFSDRVESWAETIVRFSPNPGPPDQKEADWLNRWLSADPDRSLIYIPRDFDARQEYWTEILRTLPASTDPAARDRMEAEANRAAGWVSQLPPKSTSPAKKEDWFAVDEKSAGASICKRLEGPWAAGVDAARAAISSRQTIEPGTETTLLSGDGKPLVVEYTWSSGSRVLIVANASFLLNEPLARSSRRPLLSRLIDWVGREPRQVVFVEGVASTDKAMHPPSMFDLLFDDPIGWIACHLIAFGLIGVLAVAVRIGRARGDPPSGADRPVAHAEALGGLLSRSRDARSAIAELDAYRRWRQTTTGTGKPATSRARASQASTGTSTEGSR